VNRRDRRRFASQLGNLEWFPNGSAHDATPEVQAQRIAAAADVLRPIDPDIILLQEVRDYDACSRLGEAIAPGMYHVAICSAFKEPFQSGLGKQQVAILSKYQAQAAWSERWKSMNGVDPPRGFAFAWFKIGGQDIGVYSVHLKSNLITHGDKEAETAKNIQKREVAIAQLLDAHPRRSQHYDADHQGRCDRRRFQYEPRPGHVRRRKNARLPR
jgi:hypothetical protein